MHTANHNTDTMYISITGGICMATNKRVFTLRLKDVLFDKLEALAKMEHRSTTNLIEYILLEYLDNYEKEKGAIVLPEE